MSRRKEFSKRPPDGIFGPNTGWVHGGSGTPEYSAYNNAKTLCRNPKNPRWLRYGGRGIEFRFSSFTSFMEHLGRRPAGKVLNRLNRDGHFEIGNVCWRLQRHTKRPPLPVNTFAPTTSKRVVLWATVRHAEVFSYPMFRADDGLAWLEMHETLRPEDAVIAVTPCTDQFLVVDTNGQLDMGTTPEEVQSWAEVSKTQAHKRPLSGTSTKVSRCRNETMTQRSIEQKTFEDRYRTRERCRRKRDPQSRTCVRSSDPQ